MTKIMPHRLSAALMVAALAERDQQRRIESEKLQADRPAYSLRELKEFRKQAKKDRKREMRQSKRSAE